MNSLLSTAATSSGIRDGADASWGAVSGPPRSISAFDLLESRYEALAAQVEKILRPHRVHRGVDMELAESYLLKISRYQEAGHTLLTGRPVTMVSHTSTDRSECYPTLQEHLAWQGLWRSLRVSDSPFSFASFTHPLFDGAAVSLIEQLIIDRRAVDAVIERRLERIDPNDRPYISGRTVVELLQSGGVMPVEKLYGEVFVGALFGIGPENASIFDRIKKLSVPGGDPEGRRIARSDLQPSPGFSDAQRELDQLSDPRMWGFISDLEPRLAGSGPHVSFRVHQALPETAKLCEIYGSAAEKIREFDERGMLATLLWARLLALTEIPPHGTSFL